MVSLPHREPLTLRPLLQSLRMQLKTLSDESNDTNRRVHIYVDRDRLPDFLSELDCTMSGIWGRLQREVNNTFMRSRASAASSACTMTVGMTGRTMPPGLPILVAIRALAD